MYKDKEKEKANRKKYREENKEKRLIIIGLKIKKK